MSWSVQVTGTKEKVVAACVAQFDKAAQCYVGQEEEQDVLAAKARTLSAIENLKLDEWANGIRVDCSGSRSSYSVTCKVSVERVALAI